MAMTIQELREKRKKAWDTARDFLDSKRNANGVLSEEDSKTYDAMEQTIVDLGKEIQRLERQAEIEAEMNKATSTPVLGKPAAPDVTEKTGTASDTYKTAFWNSIRNRNWIDVHDDLHIGTDAEGGYLVPDEFERKLVEALEEESIFRQMATVIKTSNGDRKIPIVTSKGEAVWMDEEQQYSLSDDQTKLGRPEGFNIHVRDAFVNAGAGFVVILTGAIMTMPGLPKKPAAFGIDVDDNGKITGLF